MARKSGKAPKRQRERNFQGWYDPEDAGELTVIRAFEHLQAQTGWNPKYIIGHAVLKMAQDDGFTGEAVLGSDNDQQFNRLFAAIDQLRKSIANGQFMAGDVVSQQVEEMFTQAAGELDAVSRSIGKRYRAVSFEDED